MAPRDQSVERTAADDGAAAAGGCAAAGCRRPVAEDWPERAAVAAVGHSRVYAEQCMSPLQGDQGGVISPSLTV